MALAAAAAGAFFVKNRLERRLKFTGVARMRLLILAEFCSSGTGVHVNMVGKGLCSKGCASD